MEHLKMHSMNKIDENISKIATLFPNCVTEAKDDNGEIVHKIDFDMLKQELSNTLVEGREERYQFTWPDKKQAILTANAPINKTLRPCREESVDFDTTENLYIEGDNLEALKLLQETYLGKIKMIYIDPPYNTGSDFLYNDNFDISQNEFSYLSGQYDENGNQLFTMNTNTESNGRFHTDWLNIMYPRLKLAKDLLTEDGVIFIHIDEGELCNLKKLCDELFYPTNFENIISIKTKVAGVSGSYMGKSLQNNTEYILFYCKNANNLFIDNIPKKRQELFDYITEYQAEGKSWKYTSVLKNIDEGEFVKTITAGNGDQIKVFIHKKYEVCSIKQIADDEFNGDLKQAYYKYINSVFRTTNAQSSIRAKVMEETEGLSSDFISIEYIPIKGKNAGQSTKVLYKDPVRNMVAFLKEVVSIEDDGIFKLDNAGNLWDDINYNNLANEAGLTYPNGQKPVQLLDRLIGMFNIQDGIVLDFFAGSATTAHSVLRSNVGKETQTKFIMVQLPENLDDNYLKATGDYKKTIKDAISFLDSIKKPHILSEFGKERIRRAGQQILKQVQNDKDSLFADEKKKLDIGFRVLKIDSSNMEDVYYTPDHIDTNDLFKNNIKSDRTGEDLLFQTMLDLGIMLSSKIETKKINGKEVFCVEVNYLMACFDDSVDEKTITEIAKEKPYYFVMRDPANSKDGDSLITNFEQIFTTYSPDTIRKVL